MRLPHAILQALLPRYSRGDLPAFLRRAVAEGLRDDVDLAAGYEALRALEAAASRAPVAAGQRELLLAGILDDVDAAAAVSKAPAWHLPVGISAAAAIVAVIVMPVVGDDDEGPHTDGSALVARGAGDEAPLGVRVRCIDGADRVVGDAVAGARQHDGALSCPDGGTLAFSLTNLGETTRYAYVVGVDGNDDVVTIAPFARDSDAVAVAPGSVDVVVPTLAPMPVVDDRGLTLHVLVNDAPFSGHDVGRGLDAARIDRLPLAAMDRLPVAVGVQARVRVYRAPSR